MLDPNDDIVIHCSNPLCPANIIGDQILERNGYKKIRRYAGGLQDWEEAGYPLEGSLIG
jgi:rhodanese-related sulfurtransferase